METVKRPVVARLWEGGKHRQSTGVFRDCFVTHCSGGYKSSCCFCRHLVAQSRLTLRSPMDGNPPGSSVHGILQARTLDWAAIASSRGIFLTQELNPCLLHWQADSFTTEPPGRPTSHHTCVRICRKYNTQSEPSCKPWALADKDV